VENQWALILGASSGFGGACSRALARAGYNICGIHLDLKQTLPMAKEVIADVEAAGVKALFINMNAADDGRRQKALDRLDQELKSTDPRAYVHVMLHSLAFGTLLPFIGEKPQDAISPAQMAMTLNVMGHSLVYWVQDLVRRGMLTRGSRIFSMTSAGSHRVFVGYGAVSAAKAALESHTRQLALELGPQGILVNCLQAGVRSPLPLDVAQQPHQCDGGRTGGKCPVDGQAGAVGTARPSGIDAGRAGGIYAAHPGYLRTGRQPLLFHRPSVG